MSKRRWSTAQYRRAQALRSRHRMGRGGESYNDATRHYNPKFQAERQATRPYVRIKPPKNFSLRTNPDGVFAFVNAMRANYSMGKNVLQDYEELSSVDTAALAIAAATVSFHQGRCLTRGNTPLDEACREVLLDSGMLTFTDYKDETHRIRGGIMTLKSQSYKAEVTTAQMLVHHATERAFGERRRLPAVYRALLEAMQNTFAHADNKEQGTELWLAHVYADPINKKATFVFLDNGVGIFKSINLKPIRSLLRSLGVSDNTQVLQEMLDRRILSSTGLTYRGRGLPSFRDAADRGKVCNMTIVSNDVYANLSSGEYRKMAVTFGGTLLFWEIQENG